EKRGRTDVIAALKKHEIGYHSNWHSVQPTPAMYLRDLGWDEGVAEFDRREGPGRADVERVFGKAPTCYGQPGPSWGPQSYGVVSIYYHPCEFVHKEFWDAVNFKGGANPPREQWKLPKAKTEEESKVSYDIFADYVRFIKRFPEVEFITASQAEKLYRDRSCA